MVVVRVVVGGAAQAFLEGGKPFSQAGTYLRQLACAEQQHNDDQDQGQFPETGHSAAPFLSRDDGCGKVQERRELPVVRMLPPVMFLTA